MFWPLSKRRPCFAPGPEAPPLTITVVLKRSNQEGFKRYLHEIYDPHSPHFHHFLTQAQIAARFGPSQKSYNALLAYLRKHGFTLIRGSANRLTLTMRGTRAQAERAFDVTIGNYQIGKRKFYANDIGPALPRKLASRVQAVTGLSDLAQPQHTSNSVPSGAIATAAGAAGARYLAAELLTAAVFDVGTAEAAAYFAAVGLFAFNLAGLLFLLAIALGLIALAVYLSSNSSAEAAVSPPPAGAGETIGLVEFDTFHASDVSDYLSLAGQAAKLLGTPVGNIGNLSVVDVGGGASATPGINESEVLLDIDDVMGIAPGAKVVVYDAPFVGAGSFQSVLNQMISDKVSIISNSWAYCENQTTLADVQSIDSILQNAAMAGISVFNGAGDTGSTCLDGSANTVAVPADSPNATAVGGSSFSFGGAQTYGSETWWNGTASLPQTGQGGFGVSKFFTRPAYQDGLSALPMRSVPDVAVNADPAGGLMICQADDGGCPNGLIYGGTSMAAPTWAAFTALLNQSAGKRLGLLNPLIYPLANSTAFHNAASMGSDFNHVGLGSPNLGNLLLRLTGRSAGPVSASASQVGTFVTPSSFSFSELGVPADGTTPGFVKVQLIDAAGNGISGKTVKIAANPGNHATISPATAVTTVDNGAAIFTVKDSTQEKITLTATDQTDSITLSQQATLTFVVPPASAAGINAFPTSVPADGMSTTSITLTLKDKLGRPTPGKLVRISQGDSHSVITGPIPTVTDAAGQIKFIAVDQVAETVTYSATDVTDGNLPFPATGTVSFNGSG